MVAPTTSPSSAISESLVMVESSGAGSCTKCDVLLGRIQELECQLEEEKEAKENMVDCLDKTFESLTNEIENHKTKDAKVLHLTAQLRDATTQLEAKFQDNAAKDFAKSIEDFKQEILNDKTALRMELDKVKQMETEQDCSEAESQPSVQELIDQVVYLESELDFANLKVLQLEYQIQEDSAHFGSSTNFLAVEDPSHSESPESIADGIQQSSIKEAEVHEKMQTKVNTPSHKLLEVQQENSLLKTARENADRILHEKFEHSNQLSLHQFAHQYNQLVQELEREKYNLVNSEQEKAYLRNHINWIVVEKESLGMRLAEANRRVSENRVSEQKLKEQVAAKSEQIEKLREKRDHLERTIESTNAEIEALVDENKQLITENCKLQKMNEQLLGAHDTSDMEESLYRDCTRTPAPSSPCTPISPKTPTTPESPVDEKPWMRGHKRRSDEYECSDNKKQKQ
ncbi:hypothetical protein CAEBREN_05379 [Caenorhabditis brenneri]|uniref:Uncharacterized protein n=1 Tax=Caenorhabditis brenneri TaxID=135651 RepID=G0MDE7_CAEBE|nr:hypothetical protein CAEBREN_05379 [Caenorhabditis brenneri]